MTTRQHAVGWRQVICGSRLYAVTGKPCVMYCVLHDKFQRCYRLSQPKFHRLLTDLQSQNPTFWKPSLTQHEQARRSSGKGLNMAKLENIKSERALFV